MLYGLHACGGCHKAVDADDHSSRPSTLLIEEHVDENKDLLVRRRRFTIRELEEMANSCKAGAERLEFPVAC